ILEASRLSMRRALARINRSFAIPCDYLLTDAIRVDVDLPQNPIIHGDSLCFSIAAASILAKVARDEAMQRWDAVFPEYGFARNRGYGTPDHLAALERLGPSTLHRFSFAPVRSASRHQVWSGYPSRAANFPQGQLALEGAYLVESPVESEIQECL
ncbi:MAG TPA: ribonuclease HII, partial [Bryobacteraceae bacterium]|nr:ribonuclease HII [Bryobacteraceae bacterium]